MPGKRILKVPRDFSTISAALAAAQQGDVIHVAAGIYREVLHITTSEITLEGEDGARLLTSLDLFTSPVDTGFYPGLIVGMLPPAGGQLPLTSFTQGVEIRGLTFETSERTTAIGIHAAGNCRITNNMFLSMGFDSINIHSNTKGLEIDHNDFAGPGMDSSTFRDTVAIDFTKFAFAPAPEYRAPSRDARIHHNRVSGFEKAIYLRGLEKGSVTHNECVGNKQGIHLEGVTGADISYNIVTGSGSDVLNENFGISVAAAGFLLRGGVSRCDFTHNESHDNVRGLYLREDRSVTVDSGYPPSDRDSFEHNNFSGNLLGSWIRDAASWPLLMKFTKNVPDLTMARSA